MTADVLPLDRAKRTAEEERVRRSIRSLLGWNDMSLEELAEQIDMPRTTMFKRMSTKPGPGRSFYLREVIEVARVFRVDLQDLVDGTVSLTGGEVSVTDADLEPMSAGVSDNLCYLTPLEPLLPPAA